MQIKINNQAVSIETRITNTTPSGNVYWSIRYYIGETTLAQAHGGPSTFAMTPVEALSITIRETLRDLDTPEAESHTARNWRGDLVTWLHSQGRFGTSDGKPAAWLDQTHTVRETIEYTLSQLIID